MVDRSRVQCIVNNKLYPNFKNALYHTGLIDLTTSGDRTAMRRNLKGGNVVLFHGFYFLPVMSTVVRYQ